MTRVWTPEQKNAIEDKGGTLLVSAAAGSGKTAVLVERIIQRLIDPSQNTPADRLLVVTYSVASANEMKERISSALAKALENNPTSNFLRSQQMLLEKAQISTIHSFCLNLISKNYVALDIAPNFKKGDDKDMELLTIDAIREVLEEEYALANDDFMDLTRLIVSGKDDKHLEQTVLKLYSFIRSHPFYDKWLESKALYFDPALDPKSSVWGDSILEYALDALNYARLLSEKALQIIRSDEKLSEGYLECFGRDRELIDSLIDCVLNKSWDDCYNSLKGVGDYFGRLKAVKLEDTFARDRCKALRDKYKDILKGLRASAFVTSEEQFKSDMAYLRPKVNALFRVVMKLDGVLTQKKKEKRIIDFSDMEHLALKLLVKNPDTMETTDIARELRDFYKMVVIDEFQDTNETQEMIFNSISKDNVFMVGDVKQCIYRFRQAMPEIFIRKSETFAPYGEESYPAKIVFNNNFRSRREITESINFIFQLIMSRKVGELEYDDEQKLYNKAVYPDNNGNNKTEIHLISSKETGEEKTKDEARFVAKKIRELIDNKFLVKGEDGELRPVAPSDICILLRATKGKAKIYTDALEKYGVSSYCDERSSFVKSREIMAVIALLKLIQNPLDDIAFCGAMLSSIFDFSVDELTRIKLESRHSHIYQSCLGYVNDETIKEDSLKLKLREFLETISRIMDFASTMSAKEVLARIYKETDYLKIVSAMEDGEIKSQNLYLLLSYAETYEEYGHKSAYGFVSFLNRLFENDIDIKSSLKPLDESVTIMTIHHSKGLEFPVVFLCDTKKQFNQQDIKEDTVLHSSLGFAAGRKDFEKRTKSLTVPLVANRLELKKMNLSEEMRILYVALTRAKEKLFITGAISSIASEIDLCNDELDANGKVPPFVVGAKRDFLDWILLSAFHSDEARELVTKYGFDFIPSQKISSPKDCLEIYFHNLALEEEETEENDAPKALAEEIEPDEDYKNNILDFLSKEYKDIEKTNLETKKSVSSLVKSREEKLFSRRPSFIQNKPSGAVRGLAFHSFMLYADLERARQDFEGEVARLKSEMFMTEAELELVSREDVFGFLDSEIYSRMARARVIKKEMPFVMKMTDEELLGIYSLPKGESIIVQGITDVCFVEENGNVVILDYKTDNCQSLDQLAREYASQLSIYEKAVSKLYSPAKIEKFIYSVKLKKEIRL